MATMTIDGTAYNLDALSDAAKAELSSVTAVDKKLASLQSDLAIYQTARNAYVQALVAALPEKVAHPNKKKGVMTINEKKYAVEDFSDHAKAQLASFQLVEQKMRDVQAEAAILQTARNAYALSLKSQLPAA